MKQCIAAFIGSNTAFGQFLHDLKFFIGPKPLTNKQLQQILAEMITDETMRQQHGHD